MKNSFLQPPVRLNSNGRLRKVGFELEFSGLYMEEISSLLSNLLNAPIFKANKYKYLINTKYGEFELILDFEFLTKREILKWFEDNNFNDDDFKNFLENIEEFVANVSSIVVPYEISTPPLGLDELSIIEEIKDVLKNAGAKGTDASIFYAFGFHINPEVYSFETKEIIDILRAFFILEEYLDEIIKPDLTRKITPYINPFDTEYKNLVIDKNYTPTQEKFIDDYLEFNPTRNRSLDLLPLLAFLDEKKVRKAIPDEKIGKRPTFHFRLPNSRVDEDSWHTYTAWNCWVLVEKLAANKEVLSLLSEIYQEYLKSLFSFLERENYINEIKRCIQKL